MLYHDSIYLGILSCFLILFTPLNALFALIIALISIVLGAIALIKHHSGLSGIIISIITVIIFISTGGEKVSDLSSKAKEDLGDRLYYFIYGEKP